MNTAYVALLTTLAHQDAGAVCEVIRGTPSWWKFLIPKIPGLYNRMMLFRKCATLEGRDYRVVDCPAHFQMRDGTWAMETYAGYIIYAYKPVASIVFWNDAMSLQHSTWVMHGWVNSFRIAGIPLKIVHNAVHHTDYGRLRDKELLTGVRSIKTYPDGSKTYADTVIDDWKGRLGITYNPILPVTDAR